MAIKRQTRSPLTTGGDLEDIIVTSVGGVEFNTVPITHPKDQLAFKRSDIGGASINVGIDPVNDSLFVVSGVTGGVTLNPSLLPP